MTSSASSRLPSVEPDEARELLSGDALMIDVRDAHEWAAGHSPHSVHVPLDSLSTSIPYTTHERRVIVVSRSGRRAKQVVVRLRAAGIDAVLLDGGLRAWIRAGGEFVADHGRTPHIVGPTHSRHA